MTKSDYFSNRIKQTIYVQHDIEALSSHHFCNKINNYYIFWTCICSLIYQACNAQAPYCHLWLIWLYNIFLHYLINGKIFEKKSYWRYNVCF